MEMFRYSNQLWVLIRMFFGIIGVCLFGCVYIGCSECKKKFLTFVKIKGNHMNYEKNRNHRNQKT
jgi:hypothetical protein